MTVRLPTRVPSFRYAAGRYGAQEHEGSGQGRLDAAAQRAAPRPAAITARNSVVKSATAIGRRVTAPRRTVSGCIADCQQGRRRHVARAAVIGPHPEHALVQAEDVRHR